MKFSQDSQIYYDKFKLLRNSTLIGKIYHNATYKTQPIWYNNILVDEFYTKFAFVWSICIRKKGANKL